MTKNFKIEEFECKCGCNMPDEVRQNVQKLANQLQHLRDLINQPITITSGYRCESHNRSIGGSKNSQHILGKAADLKVKHNTPKNVYNIIESRILSGDMLQGGLKLYPTWVHYDIRKTKARW